MPKPPASRRVFLSSTKVDLGPERTVGWLTLKLLGFDVVVASRLPGKFVGRSFRGCDYILL
jgi:hypothetical protein